MNTADYKSVSVPIETHSCLRRIAARNFRSVPQQVAFMVDSLVKEHGVLPECEHEIIDDED
jgi:hypothetical protein